MPSEILRYAAFSDDPEGGNPAGVVLDADELDDTTMLQIAAQVGFSETAFLHRPRPDRVDGVEHDRARVRFLSPQAEVDFCGHATVATAVARAVRGAARPLLLETNSGAVPVGVEARDGRPVATLTSVPTRSEELSGHVLQRLLAALRWEPQDLDPAWRPHVAFGGNHHPMVVASSRERLGRLDYDVADLGDLCREQSWTTVDLLWPETATLLHSRNPFPIGGVVEDPATGAAAAALGGYLRATRRTMGEVTILQGEDMGRPSLLTLDLPPGSDRSRVSGTAVEIPA